MKTQNLNSYDQKSHDGTPDYKTQSNGQYNDNENTRIVPDEPCIKPCVCPEHEPPMHIVIPMGSKLVHTCPACGKTVTIRPICVIC